MKIRLFILAIIAFLPFAVFSQDSFIGKVKKFVYKNYHIDSICKPQCDSDTICVYYKGEENAIFYFVESKCAGSLRKEGFVKHADGKTVNHGVEIYDSLYGAMRLICIKEFTPEGRLDTINVFKYRYDTVENKLYSYVYEEGRLYEFSVTTFDNLALPVKEVLYRFGTYGNFDENRLCGHNKSVLDKIVYSKHFVYGNSLQLLQEIKYRYSAEGISEKTVQTFSADGKLIKKQQFDPDDELVNEIVMKYDKHGNLTKRVTTFYNLDEVEKHTDEYKYKYDKHGNWVEKKYFANGKLVEAVTRLFEYCE